MPKRVAFVTFRSMNDSEFLRAQLDMISISAYCNARSRGSRVESREPLLAVNPQVAYLYSLKVLRGRFVMGEPHIAESAEWSVRYARFVLKGRFRKAEASISKSPRWSLEYAQKVMGGRLPPCMHRRMQSMVGDYFVDKYMDFQSKSDRGTTG